MLHARQKTIQQKQNPPIGSCQNCTLMLMKRCYGQHWWFRFIREPLLLGMRILALWHHIDATRYVVRNPTCHGCIRFIKAELEDKSPLFCWLNRWIAPQFKMLSGSMLTEVDRQAAKQQARVWMGENRP
jgi:hypothetical protein